MNSALYMGEMLEDGGQSELNPGGATWGTGYCDAQCYVTPFINGVVSNPTPPPPPPPKFVLCATDNWPLGKCG